MTSPKLSRIGKLKIDTIAEHLLVMRSAADKPSLDISLVVTGHIFEALKGDVLCAKVILVKKSSPENRTKNNFFLMVTTLGF